MYRIVVATEASTTRDSLAILANGFGEEVEYDVKLALVCVNSVTLQDTFASATVSLTIIQVPKPA